MKTWRPGIILALALLVSITGCGGAGVYTSPYDAVLSANYAGGSVTDCSGELCWHYVTVTARVTNTGEDPIRVSSSKFASRTADDTLTFAYKEFGLEDCADPVLISPGNSRSCEVQFHFDPGPKPDSAVFPLRVFYNELGIRAEDVVTRE